MSVTELQKHPVADRTSIPRTVRKHSERRAGNRELHTENRKRFGRAMRHSPFRIHHSSSPLRHSAFSMAESLVSILLVAGLLLVALNTVGDATVGRQNIGDRSRGTLLAQDLMAEILAQSYEEPVDIPTFGVEAPELTTQRADYDDVDDYHNWQASPPQQKDGTDIAEYPNWRRIVKVEYADPNNLVDKLVSDAGVKRITVTVEHNGIGVASLTAIRTAANDTMDDPHGLEP